MKRIALSLVLGAAALTPQVSLTHAATPRIPAACGGAVAPTGPAIVQAAKNISAWPTGPVGIVQSAGSTRWALCLLCMRAPASMCPIVTRARFMRRRM